MKSELSNTAIIVSAMMTGVGLIGMAIIWLGIIPAIGSPLNLLVFLAAAALFGAGVGKLFKQAALGAVMGVVFCYLAAQIYRTIVGR